jgi:hypothetical protein
MPEVPEAKSLLALMVLIGARPAARIGRAAQWCCSRIRMAHCGADGIVEPADLILVP